MTFHVGQKVVCVNDAWGKIGDRERPYVVHLPRERQIYTVRCFIDSTHILLNEIINPTPPALLFTCEACWLVDHFRPIVERKTDISIFKRMLIPSSPMHEKIGADEQ